MGVSVVTVVLLVLLAGSLVYTVLSIAAARRYLGVPARKLEKIVPISILKPLSGLDDGLESNLRTFFERTIPLSKFSLRCEPRMTRP